MVSLKNEFNKSDLLHARVSRYADKHIKGLDSVSRFLLSSEVAGFVGKDFVLPHPLCSFYCRHAGLWNKRLALSVCRNDVRYEGGWE